MIRWRHTRHIAAAVLPVSLLAISLLLATASAPHSPRRPELRRQLVSSAPTQTSRQRATPVVHQPAKASLHLGSAGSVALRFTSAWLSCTYHRERCSRIPGALPAYTAALHRQHATPPPTPAELAARPAIRSVSVVQACGDEAVATVTYTAGPSVRYQLHVNLVRHPAGWRVFDVSETPPHIPLPAPLARGPGTC